MSITGQRIKERRIQLEMSADDVADELGVSRSTIFRYENGHIEKVPANVLEKLAAILKTTPAYLMGWEGSVDGGAKANEIIDAVTTGLKAQPDDKDKLADMVEMFLTLTDIGKKKAYDYVIDLSEQSKYIEHPEHSKPQTSHAQNDVELTDDVK